MYDRRHIGTLALAALTAPLSRGLVSGSADVRLGVHTSSFRDLAAGADSIDALIEALAGCGARECELYAPQVEPNFGGRHGHHRTMSAMSPQMMRRELRKWRLRTADALFAAVGARFHRAGIAIYAYNYSPDRSFSDDEIDRGFEMARAMGAAIITASTTLDVARRMAPAADRHRMVVALYGGPGQDPDSLARPDNLAAAVRLSQYFKVNLEIGDGPTPGFDAVTYLREHHASVRTLRLQERRRNGEPTVWGHGEAPIREALQLVKQSGWPIHAYVNYDYAGRAGAIDEVKKCLAYATQALA